MRADLSEYLIHFTKGDSLEDSFENLKNIVKHQRVYGSNRKIRDGSNCVCFSEAPISSLPTGLLNPSFYSPYSPFGIMSTKERLFSLGGRPVIYQPENEFAHLDDSNSWRHCRYEPPKIDFTWEREWRLKTESYDFSPYDTQIILPNAAWSFRLTQEHAEDQQWQTIQYSQIMDELIAQQYEEPFVWTIIELNNTQ